MKRLSYILSYMAFMGGVGAYIFIMILGIAAVIKWIS